MKTINVSTVMNTMNNWCEKNLNSSATNSNETAHESSTLGTSCLKPDILCYGAFTLPITERKLTYGYTVELCGIDVYYTVAKAAGAEGSVKDVHYTKHITINTLTKIFDCERLFIKNIRDKNDCYIVNDRKPRLIRIYSTTESFINKEGENIEYVPYSGELLSSLQIKVYKVLKNKYDEYIKELNNEIDSCEITDDMI